MKTNKPDWRNVKDYPDAEKTTEREWARVFARRDLGYKNYDIKAEIWGLEDDWDELMNVRTLDVISGMELVEKVSGIAQTEIEVADRIEEELEAREFYWHRPTDEASPGADVAILIDLALPIQFQLDIAQKFLVSKQKTLGIKTKRKPYGQLLQNYLRILDAKDADVSNKEIASILFPNDINSIKKLENQRNAALKYMRADHYFMLAFTGKKS